MALIKSQAYYEFEQAGYNPEFYIYMSSDITRRKFTFKGQLEEDQASGLWDGSRFAGDGGSFGEDAGVSEVEPRILSLSPIVQSTTQTTRNLLTSLSASSVGHVTCSFDNVDRYFSDIISGQLPEVFEGGAFEVRSGFPGLDFNDEIPLFRGIVYDKQLNEREFRVTCDAITSTLYDVWEVPKSSLYSDPEQDNQALPLVLGDCTENSPQGIVVLPKIDDGNDVYALACHAIQTVSGGNVITLYDDDGVISGGDYTVTESGDYEGIGLTIAYVTFSVAPNGNVTGKYKGAVDSSDVLITNPAECVEKMLSIMGDPSTFEATSFAEAIANTNTEGYTCAGMIIADNPKAFWIADIMSSFMGSWFLDQNQNIVLKFDTGSDNFLATAGEFLQENTLRSPVLRGTRDNIITRVIADYAVSNAKIDLRYKSDANSAYLKTYSDDEVDGDISQPLAFNWTRNSAAVETVAVRIEGLYGAPLDIYEWKEQGLDNIEVEPGDYISFSWDYQRDDQGNYLEWQVGRVLNVTRDVQKQNLSLDFYDTGNYLLCEGNIWDGTRYAGDGRFFGGCRRGETLPEPAEDLLFDGEYYFDGDQTFGGEVA